MGAVLNELIKIIRISEQIEVRYVIFCENESSRVEHMNILISGLNNYVGRRCISNLADDKFKVYAITRNKKLLEKRLTEPVHATLATHDLMRGGAATTLPIPNLQAAYYFTQVPTLDDPLNLNLEILCLRNFIHLIKYNNCRRIIYVARLMDKSCMDPINDLLKEFAMDYTIVLKNSVIGKGALINKVFNNMAEHRLVFFPKFVSSIEFQPIGVLEFIQWLKAILAVEAFHGQTLEVGGAESISFEQLYNTYESEGMIAKRGIRLAVPKFLARFIYKYKMDMSTTDFVEFRRVVQFDGVVPNLWKKQMHFNFSSIAQVLRADQ